MASEVRAVKHFWVFIPTLNYSGFVICVMGRATPNRPRGGNAHRGRLYPKGTVVLSCPVNKLSKQCNSTKR